MPPPRNMAQEGRDSLQAQVDLAPQIMAAREKFDPQQARLNLRVLNESLFGSEGTPGVLDIYRKAEPRLTEFTAAAQSGQRERDIGDVERLGPRAAAALRASDPKAAAIEEKLAAQAMDELNSGANLDPALADSVSQSVRAAQAARGMGMGKSDVAVEGLFLGREAEAMRRSRQQFAGNVASRLRSVTGDPFMAILGRSSAVPGMAAGVTEQGRSMTSGAVNFDPFNAYAADLNNTNFNAASSAAITNANNQAALTGAAIQAGGSMLSSL